MNDLARLTGAERVRVQIVGSTVELGTQEQQPLIVTRPGEWTLPDGRGGEEPAHLARGQVVDAQVVHPALWLARVGCARAVKPKLLRLSQDFTTLTPVKKVLMQVPVRRLDQQQFFRVHPHPDMRLEPAALLELTDRQETYLVVPDVYPVVSNEVRVKALFSAITRTGVFFLWPTALPEPDGRMNS